MDLAAGAPDEPIRTALFVDFDNIYIGFEKRSRGAAERFATEPSRWLQWFEAGAHTPLPEDSAAPRRRRILVRRCYLNPREFGNYRGDFTRTAFTVVDCPPLTSRGKTSSDIYMVMDILEALEHKTRFEEFIILSADADFTPVLLRLRAHDRRTTILCSELAAAAFKAACDHVVEHDTFFAGGLGFDESEAELPLPEPAGGGIYDAVIRQAAGLVRDTVLRDGSIDARDLPRLFGTFPEFRNSNWFGRFSLKELADYIAQLEPVLAFSGDPRGAWSLVLSRTPPPTSSRLPPARSTVGHEEQERRIVEHVRELLAKAERPLPMATIATRLVQQLGKEVVASGWAGHGTFKALLNARARADIAILNVGPGFVYDPERHDPTSVGTTEDALADVRPELAAFIRRISSVTGVPALAPEDYVALFDAIVIAAEEGHTHPADLSRVARDVCQGEGRRIPRVAINFVLSSFRYHDFDPVDRSLDELAVEWRRNVVELCESAQLGLEAEQALLDEWLLPPLEEEETAPATAAAAPDAAEPAPADGSATDMLVPQDAAPA
ncbi:MAG TPA: NYN domain-containing protein [Geminicoccaceae bacterium]|nr:NYN domain-containing protein [Geminicoccaceae bacterium]